MNGYHGYSKEYRANLYMLVISRYNASWFNIVFIKKDLTEFISEHYSSGGQHGRF